MLNEVKYQKLASELLFEGWQAINYEKVKKEMPLE